MCKKELDSEMERLRGQKKNDTLRERGREGEITCRVKETEKREIERSRGKMMNQHERETRNKGELT